jgi:hypothetical protein
VHGALLTVVHPDNTPHGYNLTFAFPMLMFIIIAGALFLRFRGAHKVPGHAAISSSRWAGGAGAGTVNFGAAPVDASVGPETRATPGDAATATADAGEPAATVDTEQARPADRSTEDGE